MTFDVLIDTSLFYEAARKSSFTCWLIKHILCLLKFTKSWPQNLSCVLTSGIDVRSAYMARKINSNFNYQECAGILYKTLFGFWLMTLDDINAHWVYPLCHSKSKRSFIKKSTFVRTFISFEINIENLNNYLSKTFDHYCVSRSFKINIQKPTKLLCKSIWPLVCASS